MKIYKLTGKGEMLAHNIRPQKDNPRWRILYFLSKNGAKEQSSIIENTGASSYDLSLLVGKGLIVGGESVTM